MKTWTRDDRATQDLLCFFSDRLAMLSVIATWTDEQCQQAEGWASAKHFHASDNPVRVPEIPPHVVVLPERAWGAYDADLSHL